VGKLKGVCGSQRNRTTLALEETYATISLVVTVLMGVQVVFQVNAERAALSKLSSRDRRSRRLNSSSSTQNGACSLRHLSKRCTRCISHARSSFSSSSTRSTSSSQSTSTPTVKRCGLHSGLYQNSLLFSSLRPPTWFPTKIDLPVVCT